MEINFHYQHFQLRLFHKRIIIGKNAPIFWRLLIKLWYKVSILPLRTHNSMEIQKYLILPQILWNSITVIMLIFSIQKLMYTENRKLLCVAPSCFFLSKDQRDFSESSVLKIFFCYQLFITEPYVPSCGQGNNNDKYWKNPPF